MLRSISSAILFSEKRALGQLADRLFGNKAIGALEAALRVPNSARRDKREEVKLRCLIFGACLLAHKKGQRIHVALCLF